MRLILILFGINHVYSSCPSQFTQNNIDSGCLLNIDNPPPYIGHNIINISWNPEMFSNNIYLRLLTRNQNINYNNCFYDYININFLGSSLLSEIIPNTGRFTYHINNVNYKNIQYYLQLSKNDNLICNNGVINQNYATTIGFRLYPNLDENFRWIWPQNQNNNLEIQMGEAYNIQGSGFYHQERAAYGFNLAASISNFGPSGSWIQKNDPNIDYENIRNIPNWLNWGEYFIGNTDDVNIQWTIPENPVALAFINDEIYSLIRPNGSLILLTDSDVKLRIIAKMFIFSRDSISGIRRWCLDHNNECDDYKSSAFHSDSFRLSRISSSTYSPTNNITFSQYYYLTEFPTSTLTQSPNSTPTQVPTRSPTNIPTQSPSTQIQISTRTPRRSSNNSPSESTFNSTYLSGNIITFAPKCSSIICPNIINNFINEANYNNSNFTTLLSNAVNTTYLHELNNKSNSFNYYLIIVGCIVIILFIILISYNRKNPNKNNKIKNDSQISNIEIINSEEISNPSYINLFTDNNFHEYNVLDRSNIIQNRMTSNKRYIDPNLLPESSSSFLEEFSENHYDYPILSPK